MLPPTHRGYWATFEDIKKQFVDRKKAWMYEADPFLTKREHEAAMLKAERIRGGETPKMARIEDGMKGWQGVPVVDMGSEKRREVEKLVRKYHVWNPMEIVMPNSIKTVVVSKLAALGFRKAHVEEACEWVKDQEEALGLFMSLYKRWTIRLTLRLGGLRVAIDPRPRG